MPFPGLPAGRSRPRTEFADYLELYAVPNTSSRSPRHTRVDHVALRRRAGSLVDRRRGRAYHARQRRLCYRHLRAYAARAGLRRPSSTSSIRQLHSTEYRRPAQLPDGPVLVVGASHSGCDIAYEIAATRPTVNGAGPDTGQIPVTFDSPLFKVVFPTMLFVFRNVLRRTNPIGRKAQAHFRHGGPRLRVQQRDLGERGVDWVVGHVVGTRGGKPLLDNGRVVDVRTVVWCTGFRQAFHGVEAPAFGPDGWPVELPRGGRCGARPVLPAASNSSTPARPCSSRAPAAMPPTWSAESCSASRRSQGPGRSMPEPRDPTSRNPGTLDRNAGILR